MFRAAVLPSWTRLALTLPRQPCLVTVSTPGTRLPVQGRARRTVVARRTDLCLTVVDTVVASRTCVAVDRVGVIDLVTVDT